MTNFLGIEIDYKLTFNAHILSIFNKVSKFQGLFYRLSDFLPLSALLKIYFGLFYSNITYGILAWGCAANSVVDKLFVVQKKIVKIICGKSIYDSSTESFLKLSALKLNDVSKFFCLNHMFKVFRDSNGTYDYLLQFMSSYQPTHEYNTRDRPLRLPTVSKERYRQSFIYQGTKLWNDIPNSMKELNSLYTFKRHCKSLLIDQYK